jgi:lysophospholipase L1-like esterase
MQLSYRQKIAMTTLLVVLVIVFLLGFSEGAVRLRQWLAYGHSEKLGDLFEQQGDLRVLVPNASTRTISINSLGFRGPPLAQPKPAGDLRIAFLGASTTFCAEVSGNNMTWPHLVTEAIQKKFANISVDYVNAAVPGYTVKLSLLNFRRRVAALRPDVTIIYHATNDLSWETRSLASEQGVYEDQGKEEKSWLAEHSQLWYLVVKNLRIKEVQRDALNARKRLRFSPSKLGAQFRKDLTQLVIETKEVSAVVALVTFSYQIRPEQTPEEQLKAAGSALYYMPFMEPQGLMDAFRRYNQIITEVASETGAVLIDGETVIPGNSEHFNDSVHFTDAGSRVMAQRVSGALLGNPDFLTLVDSKRGGD